MITQDHLRRVAAWSQELDVRESEVARTGIVERSYGAEECIFMRGDRFDYWTGVVSGLARGILRRRDGAQHLDAYGIPWRDLRRRRPTVDRAAQDIRWQRSRLAAEPPGLGDRRQRSSEYSVNGRKLASPPWI